MPKEGSQSGATWAIMRCLMQNVGEQNRIAGDMAKIARTAGDRIMRLLMLVGFGLALAACSKCDVPFWRHDSPAAPQSCHDDAPLR